MAFLALLRRPNRAITDRVARAIERVQRERGFSRVYDSPTITVLTLPNEPHLIVPDGSGIILGRLFEREGYTPVETGAAAELSQLPAEFVARYWGGYLALRTRHAAAEALRDPSGGVPCYHLAVDDLHVLTASPALLVDLGLMEVEIEWTVVRQALVYRDLRPARTALRGLDEILPGVAARALPPGLTTECVWSPWRFTEKEHEVADMDAAVTAVRSAASGSISAWGSRFGRPLVEISGGLDSAIVAAGLSGSHPNTQGVTFCALAGDTDETPYARAIAERLKIELVAVGPEPQAVDLHRSASGDLARPNARSFAQALDWPERRLGESIGADAYFSGGGGDNVFSYLSSLSPIIDRLHREGLGRGVLKTMIDMAALGGTNPWAVAVRTARRLLHRRPPDDWPANAQFLVAEATDSLALPDGHPWLPVPDGALLGKRAQVMSLIRVQNHLDGHGRQAHAPIIFPLLSQPLMETCLAIPSWLWSAGGRNRAVARAAFADVLPASAIARQSKGAFDSLCVQVLAAHHITLREMLLDGALAQQGLIDRPAVERALGAPAPDGGEVLRLLMLGDVEAWVSGWLERRDRQ
ncbi:MAG TPA: asparagine synthase-related protein [Sphingomonas sp.]|nr:asparagine synthase-related protein [Sphingomonas sp.]